MNFNASEVLQMAEQIERNGASFYRRAAEFVEGEDARKMLLELADMEDDHEHTFQDMAGEIDFEAASLDPDGQAAAHMEMIADGHVFDVKTDPAELLTGKESFEEILRLAIGHEKDSIVFYEGVKSMVPAKPGKERVDSVIKEELKHIALLSRQLKQLRDA